MFTKNTYKLRWRYNIQRVYQESSIIIKLHTIVSQMSDKALPQNCFVFSDCLSFSIPLYVTSI